MFLKKQAHKFIFFIFFLKILFIYLFIYLFTYLLTYLLIYLFMREREVQRHRQREKQAPSRESNVGLDPGSPASGPELKPGVRHLTNWATQAPLYCISLLACTTLPPLLPNYELWE